MTGELALVLSGGGARGAYQVGLLRQMLRDQPRLSVPILTGVSAGALNATFLANRSGSLEGAADALAELWAELQTETVIRVDWPAILGNAARWGVRLLSGGARAAPSARGLVDPSPLRRILEQHVAGGRFEQIATNLASDALRAIAVTATEYATGQTVTWFEGRDIEGWERPRRRSERVRLSVDHVLASAALPFIFPAVKVGECWYGDGGIRLASPLAPAIHLGADRILAISTRFQAPGSNKTESCRYPPPAQIGGVLMNAVFLDAIEQDAAILERVNGLLATQNEPRRDGLRPIDLLILRPSVDLGRLAARFESELPRPLRFMSRGLGTRGMTSQDWLSTIMFHKGYIKEMMEIGARDAASCRDEIAAFVAGAG